MFLKSRLWMLIEVTLMFLSNQKQPKCPLKGTRISETQMYHFGMWTILS